MHTVAQERKTPVMGSFKRSFRMTLMALLALGFAFSANAQNEPDIYRVESFSAPLAMLSSSASGITGDNVNPSPNPVHTCSNSSFRYGSLSNTLLQASIPFEFRYFDKTYLTGKTVYLNPNGIVAFESSYWGVQTDDNSGRDINGGSVPMGGPVDTQNKNHLQYCLYPMWENTSLYGTGTSTFTAPTIRSTTIGTAPNRTFIIEFARLTKQQGLANCYPHNGGSLTYQVHLHETTNIIEFFYRLPSAGQVIPAGFSAVVGIEGKQEVGSTNQGVSPGQNASFGTDATGRMTTGSLVNMRFVPQFYRTWNGSVSNDFNDAANWDVWASGVDFFAYNAAAGSNYNTNFARPTWQNLIAYIPNLGATGVYPVIDNAAASTSGLLGFPAFQNGAFFCSGLIVDTGASVSITNGKLLVEALPDGNIVNSGSITISGSGQLAFQGNYTAQGAGTLTNTSSEPWEFGGLNVTETQQVDLGAGSIYAGHPSGIRILGKLANDPAVVEFINGPVNSTTVPALEILANAQARIVEPSDLSTIANLTVSGSLVLAPAAGATSTYTIPGTNFQSLDVENGIFTAQTTVNTSGGNVDVGDLRIFGNGSVSFGNGLTATSLYVDDDASLTFNGSVAIDTLDVQGDGNFTASGSLTGFSMAEFGGAGSVNVGAVSASAGTLVLSSDSVFTASSVSVEAFDVTGAVDLQLNGGLTILGQDSVLSLGGLAGIVIGGNVSVASPAMGNTKDNSISSLGAITVGGTIDLVGAGNNLTISGDNGTVFGSDVNVGGTLINPGTGSLTFNGSLNVGDAVTISTNMPNVIAINGDLNSGATFTQLGDGTVSVSGDANVGGLDLQGSGTTSIGGDLGISSDWIDAGSGVLSITGTLFCDYSPSTYTVKFVNRTLTVGQMVIRSQNSTPAAPEITSVVLDGAFEFTAVGIGDGAEAFWAQSNTSVSLAPGTTIALSGAGEAIVRFQGNLATNSGLMNRPTITGPANPTHKSRVRFSPGTIDTKGIGGAADAAISSTFQVDGMVIENAGNAFSSYAVQLESGTIFSVFQNVAIRDSDAAVAAMLLATGSIPSTLDSMEFSGNSPASVDASTILGLTDPSTGLPIPGGFSVSMNPEMTSMGGNLFGSGFEVDPSNAILWNETGGAVTFVSPIFLPDAVAGQPYSYELEVVGGNAPYQWTESIPAIPVALDLHLGGVDGNGIQRKPNELWSDMIPTGVLSGNFEIVVTDSSSPALSTSRNFTLNVSGGSGPVPLAITTTQSQISTNSLRTCTQYNSQNPVFLLEAEGGTGSDTYIWSISSGVPPTNMSVQNLDPAVDPTYEGKGGFFTTAEGIPFGQAGSVTLTVRVADSLTSATKTFSINVIEGLCPPVINLVPLPTAEVSKIYRTISDTAVALTATGGQTPYVWSLANGTTLPDGLELNQFGEIIGTPRESTGTPATFDVLVIDANSRTASASFALLVNPKDTGPIFISNPDNAGGCAMDSGSSNLWFLLVILGLVAMAAGGRVALQRVRR